MKGLIAWYEINLWQSYAVGAESLAIHWHGAHFLVNMLSAQKCHDKGGGGVGSREVEGFDMDLTKTEN